MTTAAPLAITDPTAAPTFGDGPLSRWCKRALYDPRDEVFVRLTLKVILVFGLGMIGLYRFFHWGLVPVYLALWGWFTPPVILMLHCTMHRPFIRRQQIQRFALSEPIRDRGPDDVSPLRVSDIPFDGIDW